MVQENKYTEIVRIGRLLCLSDHLGEMRGSFFKKVPSPLHARRENRIPRNRICCSQGPLQPLFMMGEVTHISPR